MSSRHKTALTVFTVAVLTICVATWAVGGRDFVGIYWTTNVSDSGEEVFMTFSTEILNYFGEDVNGATVDLRGVVHPNTVYTAFSAVAIASDETVRLTADITVPADEHDAWLLGHVPALTVDFQDATGGSHLSAVELAPVLFVDEE